MGDMWTDGENITILSSSYLSLLGCNLFGSNAINCALACLLAAVATTVLMPMTLEKTTNLQTDLLKGKQISIFYDHHHRRRRVVSTHFGP